MQDLGVLTAYVYDRTNARHERCGAERCADLKGRDTGVMLCPCDDCVRNAVIECERALRA